MSVYSMTGYAGSTVTPLANPDSGSSTAPDDPRTPIGVHIEIRSVNSRFLDLVFRLPDELRGLEPALRDLLSQSLKRGKVELRLKTSSATDAATPQPAIEQLQRLAHLQASVQACFPQAASLSVNEVLQWCQSGPMALPPDPAVMRAARQALAELLESRASEGCKLVAVLSERLDQLRTLAAQAEPLVGITIERQKQKFILRWQEALELCAASSKTTPEALQERFLNETAAFAIRIDIAEELARLRAHLDEIARLLQAGGEVGKRLDFLIQELLREANTLASKASCINLTNISVEMKVIIEQLREQVQNLE